MFSMIFCVGIFSIGLAKQHAPMDSYISLDDFQGYKDAHNLSNVVWDIVSEWDWFAKKTIGTQFVTAVDSISANIAEGYGRYFKKDKMKFYYYSRGSVKEAIDWCNKAHVRGLLTEEQYQRISNILHSLPKEINWLINMTHHKLKI